VAFMVVSSRHLLAPDGPLIPEGQKPLPILPANVWLASRVHGSIAPQGAEPGECKNHKRTVTINAAATHA